MKPDPNFDPKEHRLAETSYFEDLRIGQKFPIPSRTLGDANFAAFQLASGDNHPIHYDVEYCRANGHRDLLAHGFQVVIQTAPGAGMMPHIMGEAMVAFIEQSSKFLAPVYAGDTVYPNLEIIELKPNRSTGVVTVRSTVHNQDRVLVMEGEQKFLMKKRDPHSG
jgi:acyl dehydratase